MLIFKTFLMYFLLQTDLVIGYLNVISAPAKFTDFGVVIGNLKLSRNGRFFEAYTGIPYAKPPVGSLRFKEPQPLSKKPLRFIDARSDTPICIQKNYLFENPIVKGQEDCLYLNVYVPQCVQECVQDDLLPVMVFIHWGAFIAGQGGPSYLGPEYLMDKNVILVTFNYRLGPFGFLTTLDDAAPGNYALKDQRLALQWVQKNIKFFRGDKDRVTLFGQSAGGGSAHYHMISPSSKGLFQQIITQSGSALAPWAKQQTELQKTVTALQAKFVGCSEFMGNSENLINCLRSVPADVLLDTQDYFKVFSVDPFTAYSPVVEKESEKNPNPFFTKELLEYVTSGEFQKIPWMSGTVKDDGILRVSNLVRNSTNLKNLNGNLSVILPTILGFSKDNPENLYQNMIEMYLQREERIDINRSESVQGLIDIYTDLAFTFPNYQSVMLQGALGHQPIWVYEFNYRSAYSYADLFAATSETVPFKWGVCHCDDLLYLFKSPGLFPEISDVNDVALSQIMINLWTNFAIYGNPNSPNQTQPDQLIWPNILISNLEEMNNENFIVLNIEGNSVTGPYFNISRGFYKDRMKFWANSGLFNHTEGLN